MRRWFALSAIGKDRPGIVADLAELIYESGCNLEDSSMTILGGEFAVLLLFSGTGEDLDSKIAGACKHLEWERRLTIFVRPLDGPPEPYGRTDDRRRWEIEAIGVDKAGIVAKVSRALADRDVTILRLRTRSRAEPESGTPIYAMRIEMNAPEAASAKDLQAQMDRLAEDLNIEISLRAVTDPED